jgi:hypothetical protein
MEQTQSFPIKLNELEHYRQEATRYMISCVWEQSNSARNREGKDNNNILLFLSKATGDGSGGVKAETFGTVKTLMKKLLPHSIALPPALSQTTYALQEGIAIGNWVRESYADASGLSNLREKIATLDANGKRDFESKMQTGTSFMLFSIASYVLHQLRPLSSSDLSVMKNKFAGIPEVSVVSPSKGISCMLFYYNKYLNHPDVILSDKDVVDLTVVFFETLLDELAQRRTSLQFTECITDRNYKLENSEFVISGWDGMGGDNAVSTEFNKIKFEQIVGNKDAKHFARRLTERLLSYDFTAKKNPFQELGGFMPVFMGYGIPGTGKSMLIAAIATKLQEHAEQLDIPFLFHPMPDTLISTFQGGSAERMVEWMKPLSDPTRLIFAPIDDAENNLQERTQQGVSAGVKEVIGVFLRYTEGAYAVNYGNSSVGLFTNLPEMLDKAVISRIQGRFKIDGAQRVNDFIDQDYIWWRKLDESVKGFVDMKNPTSYEYLADQKMVSHIGEVLDNLQEPKEAAVIKAFEIAKSEASLDEHAFFAKLYKETQKSFPFFSSRDVRNIQSAISLRLTDFDLEPDWLDNPKIFIQQNYERKFNMLKELMQSNMKGLSFAEIRLQEVIRYLDNYATIADTDFKRQVEKQVERNKIFEEAKKTMDNG